MTYDINIKIRVFSGTLEDIEWFAQHACCALDHMLSVDGSIPCNGAAVYRVEAKE